jgi:hypothetical protein
MVDDRTACSLRERGYYYISALPLPALISIDDLNFLPPSEIKLKHLPIALMIVVLMQEPFAV